MCNCPIGNWDQIRLRNKYWHFPFFLIQAYQRSRNSLELLETRALWFWKRLVTLTLPKLLLYPVTITLYGSWIEFIESFESIPFCWASLLWRRLRRAIRLWPSASVTVVCFYCAAKTMHQHQFRPYSFHPFLMSLRFYSLHTITHELRTLGTGHDF